MYVGISNPAGTTSRTVKFGEMLLAPGSNTTFRRPPAGGSSGAGGVLFVSPTGLDTAAGSIAAPMATAQAAINKMGGSGTVIFLPGA